MRGALIFASASVLFAVGCGSSGSESSSSDAQPFVDALVDDMTTVDERGDFVLGDDDAGCLAPRLVEIVGMDAIERSQATPEEFAKADSLSELDLTVDSRDEEEIVEAFNQCLDEDSLLPGFADSFGVEQVPEACTAFFSTETWAPIFAATYAHGSEAEITDLFADAPGACAERLMLSAAVAEGDLATAQADCTADRLDDDDAQEVWRAILADSETWTTTNPELATVFQKAINSCV
jgi:hypothetical protein